MDTYYNRMTDTVLLNYLFKSYISLICRKSKYSNSDKALSSDIQFISDVCAVGYQIVL